MSILGKFLHHCIRPVLKGFGYNLVRYYKTHDSFRDIKRILPKQDLLIFDIGANVGQTAKDFEAEFPRATIHSFEPSPSTFKKLKKAVHPEQTRAWNLALGAKAGQQTFLENESPDMSSFLPLGERGWGHIEKETLVAVSTIDLFCAEHKIERINLLKSDTQGYDFEVFKGAEGMLKAGKIDLILFEVTFSSIYEGAPHFEDIFRFLNQHGYQLHRVYGLGHVNQAIWTDVLFIPERLLPKT